MKEKRRKRFTLIMLDTIDELEHHSITEEDAVFVMGRNNDWLSDVIEVCELYFHNRVILFGNHKKQLSSGKYSIITPDITQDIQILYNYLVSHGKTRIAMYGINPHSTLDDFRKENFLSCGGSANDLFYNSGSLSECYNSFSQSTQTYDAVICTNDYAAISLIRSLGKDNQLFVTSCGGGTLLTHFFSPSITHTWIDYQAFGKTALNLCDILQKSEHINSINIYISGELSIGETTNNLPLIPEPDAETTTTPKPTTDYYSDSEVEEMLRVETLLDSCDEEDFLVLDSLLNNMTYAKLAEKLFMSVNGVKYKVKKMFDICQVSSKDELIGLLNKYKRYEKDL